MGKIFNKPHWSPYTVGISIGIITWITFLFMLKLPGVSTTFVRLVGFVISIFSLDHISMTPYLSKYVEFRPVFEWQFALVVGIFFGARLSAKLSRSTFGPIPYLWGQRFGFSKRKRILGAMLGGFLILFGARMAGGCTMGHGISGALQLAITSWIFIPVMLTAGIITAKIFYRNTHNTGE